MPTNKHTKATTNDHHQNHDDAYLYLLEILKVATHFKNTAQQHPWVCPEATKPKPNTNNQQNLLKAITTFPEHKRDKNEILQLLQTLLPHLIATQNPLFMGHMTSDIPYPAHEADILISFCNQNLVKLETSGIATVVEKQVVKYFHKLLFHHSEDFYKEHLENPSSTLGMLVSGGTIAGLTALTIARNHALENAQHTGIHHALKHSHYTNCVILTSKLAHYSVGKIAALMGLGKAQVIYLDVDPQSQKVKTKDIEETIHKLHKQRILIMAYVALAGATETGTVDDLVTISEICQKHNIWLHVDAAWAGGYLFSTKLASKLKGIEKANSVIVDGHKLLGLTVGCGMVYFRNPTHPTLIEESSRYVLRPDSPEDAGRFHLEGSRPFYALKLWMLLQREGTKGICKRVENAHRLATSFATIIHNHPAMHLISPNETAIIVYRWCPDYIESHITSSTATDTPKHIIKYLVDVLNLTHDHLWQLGWAKKLPGFVSKTKLHISTSSQATIHEATVLRAIPINMHLKEADIHHFLAKQHQHGTEFFHQKLQEYLHPSNSHPHLHHYPSHAHSPLPNILTHLAEDLKPHHMENP